MYFRRAMQKDVEAIVKMVSQAQAYFRGHGIEQWPWGYPARDNCIKDLKSGVLYVMDDNGNAIGALAAIPDEDMGEIEGKWTNGGQYVTLRRIVVLGERKRQSVFTQMLQYIEKICPDWGAKYLRVDIHRKNKPLLDALLKNGFTECGFINVKEGPESGTKRIALEKSLNPIP